MNIALETYGQRVNLSAQREVTDSSMLEACTELNRHPG